MNGSTFIDLEVSTMALGNVALKKMLQASKSSATRPFEQELHHAEIEHNFIIVEKQKHIYSTHLHIHQ